MERIVHKGIPITVEVNKENYTSADILLTSPNKQWRFTIIYKSCEVSGRVVNLDPRRRNIGPTGETTALAEVGMEQIANYAREIGSPLWYEFDTKDPRLITWYTRYGGREALGINMDESVTRRNVKASRMFEG